MTILPAVIIKAPTMTFAFIGSFKNMNDRQMVITTLSLSMGATRDTSPSCKVLK